MSLASDRHSRGFTLTLCIAFTCLYFGCGFIADKDLIRVGKMEGRYITRGDLFRILREMPPDERPLIQTKGDLLRVLQNYVHDEIKKTLARQLAAEGKIRVPREQAVRLFDAQNPEFVVDIPNPEEYDLTQGQLDLMRGERETRIDRIQEKLLGEEAVNYRIEQAVRARTLAVTREEMEQEYRLRIRELVKPESVRFAGIGFPLAQPEASANAANARKRLDAGEAFNDVAEDCSQSDGAYALQMAVVADPGNRAFRNFWLSASGSEKGDIIGPVFVKSSEVLTTNPEGQTAARRLPDAYLVCEILDSSPERVMSLEEAAPEVLQPILYSKMIEMLEQEFGVELYEDKLPDPTIYGAPSDLF